jgi:hypothetical protein
MPIRVSADARYRLMGLNGMPEGDALIRIGMCVYRGGEGIFDLVGPAMTIVSPASCFV